MTLSATAPAAIEGGGSQRQPSGVFYLTLVEFWERFAFYSVFYLIALFLSAPPRTGGAGWSDATVVQITGMFGGLAFVLPVVGGWISSRWWGNIRSARVGTIIGSAGYFTVACYAYRPEALPPAIAPIGLILAAIGTGFFKPSISALVGSFYRENDGRRERGYLVFMAGISAGALTGGLVCGLLSDYIGWFWAMSMPAVAMLIAAALMFAGSGFITRAEILATGGAGAAGKAALGPRERKQIALILSFSLLNIVYIAIYFQCFGTLNLFIERHVDRSVMGVTVPTIWLSSWLNLVFLIGCMISSRLWIMLDRRGRNPNVFQKQAVGFVILSIAFLVLANASWSAAMAPNRMAAIGWIIGAYAIFATADICTQPLQLNAAGGYAPRGYASLMIGIWILSTGLGSFASGFIGSSVEPAAFAQNMARGSAFLAGTAVVAWLCSLFFRTSLTSHDSKGPA